MKNPIKIFKYLGVVFILASFGFCLLAFNSYQEGVQFYAKAETVQAKIVGFKDNGKKKMQTPIMQFTDKVGVLHTMDANSSTNQMEVGTTYTGYYLAEDEEELRLASNTFTKFFDAFVLLIMAPIFLLLGLLGYRVGTAADRAKKRAASYTLLVNATITQVMRNINVTINNRAAFKAQAVWTDPLTRI